MSRNSSETREPGREQQSKAKEDWEKWLKSSVMRKECECGKLRKELEEVKVIQLEDMMYTLFENKEQKEKQAEKLEGELSKENEAARKARRDGREVQKETERMLDD